MTFKPLGKRVLIERVEEPTTTATGIIIPDNAKEKPLSGIVRAISAKVEEKGLVSLGDKVVFAKYAGTELTIDGNKYLVMTTDEILGVL
ncbi:MAG: co-chaperone GroES [Sulfurospirillaceae bacterium]|nr:co-chaperone GroES [Sulfurospirillaceae bacterium]